MVTAYDEVPSLRNFTWWRGFVVVCGGLSSSPMRVYRLYPGELIILKVYSRTRAPSVKDGRF